MEIASEESNFEKETYYRNQIRQFTPDSKAATYYEWKRKIV